jgi:hypothetical protein
MLDHDQRVAGVPEDRVVQPGGREAGHVVGDAVQLPERSGANFLREQDQGFVHLVVSRGERW